MYLTMLAIMTAFVSLVFAYFFYWTIHEDFPPATASGPGIYWPCVAGALLLGSWTLTQLARRWNRVDRGGPFCFAIVVAIGLALAGGAAILAGPWFTGLDPKSHVYPAIVWLLAIWCALHAAVGALMQFYCLARRLAGRMTGRHDIDIANVALFWHFVAVTIVITVAVISGFPLVK
jgi:cytochrome c oxidase subunit I+III